jgi:hypothetical protein
MRVRVCRSGVGWGVCGVHRTTRPGGTRQNKTLLGSTQWTHGCPQTPSRRQKAPDGPDLELGRGKGRERGHEYGVRRGAQGLTWGVLPRTGGCILQTEQGVPGERALHVTDDFPRHATRLHASSALLPHCIKQCRLEEEGGGGV